ncbi:MAG: hypothetical protein ACJAUR_000180 [Ulvibacter sp.]|jgi:hypothetical protein
MLVNFFSFINGLSLLHRELIVELIPKRARRLITYGVSNLSAK